MYILHQINYMSFTGQWVNMMYFPLIHVGIAQKPKMKSSGAQTSMVWLDFHKESELGQYDLLGHTFFLQLKLGCPDLFWQS